MKAISLIQPWATLVIVGAKKIETRSWRHTEKYRGPLAIHASKRFPREVRALCEREPFRSALAAAGYATAADLPRGCVLGVAELVDAYRFTAPADTVPEPERSFGDFTPGRCGLVLANPIPLPTPCRQQGSLGLFNVADCFLAICRTGASLRS